MASLAIDYYCVPACKKCKDERECPKAHLNAKPIPRQWIPANEPPVLLQCGCIVAGWPLVQLLGLGKLITDCNKHGEQVVVREANLRDFAKRAGINIGDSAKGDVLW